MLFVCVGNLCRSPLAERLLAARLAGEPFAVSSAGVSVRAGATMAPEAAAELAARGGSAAGFVSRRLTEEMLRRADLVLTATQDLRSRLLADLPGALHRSFTIREFAALVDEVDAGTPSELVAAAAAARSEARPGDYDVPDPWKRGPEEHARAASLIDEAVDHVAKALLR
ncbi:MAG: hypothetical protein ACRDPH_14285 [Marmoricola sp.]